MIDAVIMMIQNTMRGIGERSVKQESHNGSQARIFIEPACAIMRHASKQNRKNVSLKGMSDLKILRNP
ncbi:hypothetical protein [Rhizobium sp. Leaf262]|uniref:hypothetical protein n=1 Tax=Rhizobium sp. Leaf262 TaxID=1736312 RepID=UPI0012E7DD37|nr:hypothetical protein [Rhizobium sp. Leaf262]